MGMFDPYEPGEIGESAELLRDHYQTFILLEAKVRKGIETIHGVRTAADLYVATTEPGVRRYFSSLWSGLAGQIKRIEPGDLPATVRLVAKDTGQSSPTYVLEMVEKPDLPTDRAERDRVLAIAAGTLVRPVEPPADAHAGEPGDQGAPIDETQAAVA